MRTPSKQSTIISALAFVLLLWSTVASIQADPGSADRTQYAWITFGGLVACAAVFAFVYAHFSHGSRKAVRRIRKEMPDAESVVARADDYLLGTIALLRPDINDPMGLGRYVAIVLSDTAFQIWGGAGGDMEMLNVPWRYVESVRVEDMKVLFGTFPGLAVRLVGAGETPLKFSPCNPGFGVFRPRSLVQTELLASRMGELRNHAAVGFK